MVGAVQDKVDGDVVRLNENFPEGNHGGRVQGETTKVLFVFPFVQDLHL